MFCRMAARNGRFATGNWRPPASSLLKRRQTTGRFVKTWSQIAHRGAFLSFPFLSVMMLCLSGLALQLEGADATKESLLTVRVNGVEVGDSEAVLELDPGRMFVPVAVFRKGRLRVPAQRPMHVSALGLDYYP